MIICNLSLWTVESGNQAFLLLKREVSFTNHHLRAHIFFFLPLVIELTAIKIQSLSRHAADLLLLMLLLRRGFLTSQIKHIMLTFDSQLLFYIQESC